MNTTREICKLCYEINRVGFSVPYATWQAVIPIQWQNKIVCLNCFTRLADEKFIEWDKDIKFYPVSFYSHCKK